jgi:three-Cys-motif partner protein
MTRKTTKTGQQYSESTPYKLKGFRYLMGFHSGVCKIILNKPEFQNSKYIYVDLNCGAGDQSEYREFGDEVLGSPIIALQELNHKEIEPICHFCDSSQESLDILKETIDKLKLKCVPTYWHGDNKKSLIEISKTVNDYNFYGLVYSDPNGKQDFPLKEIQETFQLSQMKRVDLLLNVATTYVKRWENNPKVTWDAYSLDDLITGHGKKFTFIRQPENPSLKWTFVYATNWDKQKDLKNIKLYKTDGTIGQKIIDHLFDPKSNPAPQIAKDGSVTIQPNLLDLINPTVDNNEV